VEGRGPVDTCTSRQTLLQALHITMQSDSAHIPLLVCERRGLAHLCAAVWEDVGVGAGTGVVE
jgi:hypothetical protein